MRIGLLGLIANITGVVSAAVLIWGPEIGAYWVWPATPNEAAVERALREPPDEVLTEIARQRLGLPVIAKVLPEYERAETLRAAERLLSGEVAFPKQPSVFVHVPIRSVDLNAGPPTHQLYVAGLGTVDLLLRAYRLSADDRFLLAAREEVAAFAKIDDEALIPNGFLWNDHALANRLSILADFWQIVRSRADLDRVSAAQVLALAARTAQRLAKPELFTFRSNHGVMQSVALLQYAVAFPSIEGAAQLLALGCSRLEDQLQFYVSPEGPVLEHSAGYHEYGRYMLETSIRLFELSNCEIPPAWRRKLKLAREFSATLWRPDGTLPPFGNTDYEESTNGYGDWIPASPGRPFSLYPVSGFAVWWSGLSSWPRIDGLSQTIVTWSNFPSRAHKRADDMSITVWADGRSWLGSTGYWPYGAPGFEAAQGWRGSNSPHFVGEADVGYPPAQLRGAVDAGRVRAIELERHVAQFNGVLRRQIVDIDGTTWLIADSFSGGNKKWVDRIWTMLPETQVATLAENGFLLRAPAESMSARLTIAGQVAEPPELVRGQLDPFGGWIVRRGAPTPAPALLVRQSAPEMPVISVLELARETEQGASTLPAIAPDSSVDRWKVSLANDHGLNEVVWSNGLLTVKFADGSESIAQLVAPEDSSRAREAIIAAYRRLEETYPRFRDLTYYRYRITYLGAGLLALQEAVMLGLRRRYGRAVPVLRLLAAASWLAFGLLGTLWYLK